MTHSHPQSGLRIAVIVLAIALSSPAMAQKFNVDIGNGFGTPQNSYGGAMGASGIGFWNDVGAPGSFTLQRITGEPSCVTLAIRGSGQLFNFDNLGTAGNDQALLDDLYIFGPSVITCTFTGLKNTLYDVMTYAWAPDSPTFLTSVVVPGGSLVAGDSMIGGAWSAAGFMAGVTHAHHQKFVTDGTLTITLSGQPFGSLGGIQIGPLTDTPIITPDLNEDSTVNGVDLGILLSAWSTSLADLNCDNITNGIDLGILLTAWTK